ncbi:MAG: hypothetical protein HQM00_02870 [Magnetococcales bacterium]|nr:hypothetical protein [Magnetococcales bacterium]
MTITEHASHQEEIAGSSDRSFGWVFTGVFGVIALWPVWHGGAVRLWALGVALLLLIVSQIAPRLLSPFNRLWSRLGGWLHRMMTPVIMGVIFFVVITPFALFFRLTGKDPLKRKFQPELPSYWIPRSPPGPDPATMKHPF